jgi:hypothetical protein
MFFLFFLPPCFSSILSFDEECSPISALLATLLSPIWSSPCVKETLQAPESTPLEHTPTPNHRWQQSERISGTHSAAVFGAETRITNRTYVCHRRSAGCSTGACKRRSRLSMACTGCSPSRARTSLTKRVLHCCYTATLLLHCYHTVVALLQRTLSPSSTLLHYLLR